MQKQVSIQLGNAFQSCTFPECISIIYFISSDCIILLKFFHWIFSFHRLLLFLRLAFVFAVISGGLNYRTACIQTTVNTSYGRSFALVALHSINFCCFNFLLSFRSHFTALVLYRFQYNFKSYVLLFVWQCECERVYFFVKCR